MSVSESDLVLSAIRRGEETLPKLKAATGIGYARLQTVLYNLEFERCSIARSESAEGFDRYYPSVKGKAQKGAHWQDGSNPVSPRALTKTQAAESAADAAREQRAAPYCVGCQGVCMLNGAEEGRRRWRCGTCDLAFPGSLMEVEVAHIDTHEEGEARVRGIIERGQAPMSAVKRPQLGPEEVRAIEAMREEDVVDSAPPEMCFCGREARHRGQHKGQATRKTTSNGGGPASVKAAKPRKVTGAQSISPSPVGETLGLQESYQAILGELCNDRGALGRVIEIFKREKETGVRITETTQRPAPTSIQPAWPKYFEEDTDTATGEGQVGMGLFYLLSILHDSMEEHEKQAVWTLVQYMKRMQAASEAAKADKLALST